MITYHFQLLVKLIFSFESLQAGFDVLVVYKRALSKFFFLCLFDLLLYPLSPVKDVLILISQVEFNLNDSISLSTLS